MTTPEDRNAFLNCFFGPGNLLTWPIPKSAESAAIRSALEPWVARFLNRDSPWILPRVEPTTKLTIWYVLCADPRQARSTREMLQAFIGPTYADFHGESAVLDETDPIENLVSQHFGESVFRLPVTKPADRPRVAELLEQLLICREKSAGRTTQTTKPLGRLLRDLEMALVVGNEDSARQIQSEIRSRGRLSAINLAFLQIRILGAFERWDEIVRLPTINELLQVRRPKRISELIATGVYQLFIQSAEAANDPQAALAGMRASNRFQVLVRSTEGFASPAAIKLAVVAALAASPPDLATGRRIIEQQVGTHDQAWCKTLFDSVSIVEPPPVVASPSETADSEFAKGNFDAAFALYLIQEPSFASVCRVLEIAVEVDTLTAATTAIDYLNTAAPEIAHKVNSRRNCQRQIELLGGLLRPSSVSLAAISNWCDWFRFVDEAEDPSHAHQILERGCREWVATTPNEITTESNQIAEFLGKSRAGLPRELVRNAVPILMEAFLRDDAGRRWRKPIYYALIDLIIYDEAISADDLAAVEQLLETVLTDSPNRDGVTNDFALAVAIAGDVWKEVSSPRHLDWALSLLDLLIDVGASERADLTPVLAAIVESVAIWPRRVRDDQWSMLQLLASDLRLAEVLSGVLPLVPTRVDGDQPSPREQLKGQSIAVYSLTERIARRFGQLVENAFDGIKLHYIHDKALTDRMKSLAKTADIFIINTWDAKHAATNGIKDNRPKEAVTLEPQGKSATSLLHCLREFAFRA
jgi:hypothetical protein